ncbi:MAG: exonuclease SbcCD subunit D [Armatimonadota bacterium]|nr:MAG: exonuclease SbcCD subunit D [Armatimonadota bacterium]
MRLLHLGDLHLGTENYGRPDPATGLNTRLFDFLRCFDVAVDRAIEREADLVVFVGDAYRSREPNPTHQREFARRIFRLVSAGTPVLLLVGNHDLPSLPAKASSLDVFSALEVPGVAVIRQPQVLDMETKSGVVRCACFPALPRAALLEDGDRRLDADALRRTLSRRLTQKLADLGAKVGDFTPAILAAHIGVEGAMVGSEASLVSGTEPLVPVQAVADSRYAYVALGHVHRFQEMDGGPPPVVYCGSLERVDFGEEGQQKGFVIVDIERGKTSYEFVPTPARRFVTIEVATRGPDATAEVEAAIATVEVADAVVRTRVMMDEEQPLDEERLRGSLRDAYAALPIQKEVRSPRVAPRAPGVAERMTDPLAALDEYLELRGVSAQRARDMRAKAEAILATMRQETEPSFGAAESELDLGMNEADADTSSASPASEPSGDADASDGERTADA